MRRLLRVLIEVLCPPLLGTLGFLWIVSLSARDNGQLLHAFPYIILAGYVGAGIPSMLFAVIMEIAFARGLPVRSWRTVLVAAGLGLFSGAAIGVVISIGPAGGFQVLGFTLPIGVVVGTLTGLILRITGAAASLSPTLSSAPPA